MVVLFLWRCVEAIGCDDVGWWCHNWIQHPAIIQWPGIQALYDEAASLFMCFMSGNEFDLLHIRVYPPLAWRIGIYEKGFVSLSKYRSSLTNSELPTCTTFVFTPGKFSFSFWKISASSLPRSFSSAGKCCVIFIFLGVQALLWMPRFFFWIKLELWPVCRSSLLGWAFGCVLYLEHPLYAPFQAQCFPWIHMLSGNVAYFTLFFIQVVNVSRFPPVQKLSDHGLRIGKWEVPRPRASFAFFFFFVPLFPV